jgi:RNA recognition motif-containing protein
MKIYVGNLSQITTEENLKQAFASFGNVQSVRIVRSSGTGESQGFGFVTMESETEAQAAISEMNDKQLDGQAVKAEKGRAQTHVIRTKPAKGGPGQNSRGTANRRYR